MGTKNPAIYPDGKCVADQLAILCELRDVFWNGAFAESRRCGTSRDGEYHVPTDIDTVAMYCGNIFQ